LRHFGALLPKVGDFLQFCDDGHPLKGLAKFGYSSERKVNKFQKLFVLVTLAHFSTNPSNWQEAAIAGNRVVHGSPDSLSSNW